MAARRVANKSILVTGGCSGLGFATAQQLISAGAKITVLDIKKNDDAMSKLGANAQFIETDVTNAESVAAAVQAAKDKFGGLNGAVSCAGICPAGKVVGKKGPHDLDVFSKTLMINVVGTFNVLRLAAAAMKENAPDAECDGERGVIVNTASIAAFEGQIGQCAYAASKGAVHSLTLPAARELASLGIRVNTIAPGIMGTPMLAGLKPEAQESLGKSVPYPQRLGNPTEFGRLVQHIFENGYFNGETIRLDGSLRMGSM